MDYGGDDGALFRSLYAELRRFAAVVAPIETDPDDLLQEALSKTLAHHRLVDLENPSAYLHVAIVRLASNERRRLGRQRRAIVRLEQDDDGALPDYPSEGVALSGLEPFDRALLYLSVVEDLPSHTVAQLLGRSEAAVRMRKHRVLRALRVTLEKEAIDDA